MISLPTSVASRTPRRFHRIIWWLAWLSTAAGMAIMAIAWRARAEVRGAGIHTRAIYVFVWVTPLHVNVRWWATADDDVAATPGDYWAQTTYVVGPFVLLRQALPATQERAIQTTLLTDCNWSWHAAGFAYISGHPNLPTRRDVYAPTWVVIAVLLAPLTRLTFGRALRRRRHGHCDNCGYDLRATPGRCPECGWVEGQEKAGIQFKKCPWG